MPPACWELCPSTAGITTKPIHPQTGRHIGVGAGGLCLGLSKRGVAGEQMEARQFLASRQMHPLVLLSMNCPKRHMLALGPQDDILVSGPQDSAVGLDHLHRAVASSKYVTYAIVPEGWEQCTPVPVGMCPCDTVSTVGEEAAGRAFSEGDGKYRSHRPALAG